MTVRPSHYGLLLTIRHLFGLQNVLSKKANIALRHYPSSQTVGCIKNRYIDNIKSNFKCFSYGKHSHLVFQIDKDVRVKSPHCEEFKENSVKCSFTADR